MNWIMRLGQWWEERRIVRKPELDILEGCIKLQGDWIKTAQENFTLIVEKLRFLETHNKLPENIAKDLALLNVRLNRLELYVGLKRDAAPIEVPGSAKIS